MSEDPIPILLGRIQELKAENQKLKVVSAGLGFALAKLHDDCEICGPETLCWAARRLEEWLNS